MTHTRCTLSHFENLNVHKNFISVSFLGIFKIIFLPMTSNVTDEIVGKVTDVWVTAVFSTVFSASMGVLSSLVFVGSISRSGKRAFNCVKAAFVYGNSYFLLAHIPWFSRDMRNRDFSKSTFRFFYLRIYPDFRVICAIGRRQKSFTQKTVGFWIGGAHLKDLLRRTIPLRGHRCNLSLRLSLLSPAAE